eukprot:3112553-Rhodomonas_salina.1
MRYLPALAHAQNHSVMTDAPKQRPDQRLRRNWTDQDLVDGANSPPRVAVDRGRVNVEGVGCDAI